MSYESRFRSDIQSCDKAYSNPYRMDPTAVAVSKKMRKERDSIAPSEQKLLEDFLKSQIIHNRLPPGATTLIANLGRGLVLMIVMPPFLVLYKTPKWIFEQLSPLLVKAAKEGGEKLGNMLLLILAWPTELYARIQDRLKKALQFRLKKPQTKKGDNLFQLLMKDLRAHGQKILTPLRWVAKTINNVQKNIKSTKNAFKEKLQLGNKAFLAFIKQGQQSIKNGVNEALKKIKQTANSLMPTLKNVTIKALKPLDKLLEVSLGAITQVVQAGSKLFAAFSNPLAYFYQHTITEAAKATYKAITKPLEMVSNALSSSATWMKQQAQLVVQPFMNLNAVINDRSQRVKVYAQQTLEKYQRGVVDKMRQVARAMKRLLEPMQIYVRKLWDQSKEGAKKQLQKWQKRANQAALKTKQAAIWLALHVKHFPSLCLKWLRRLYIWTIRLCKKFFWAIRVTFTWMKILLQYSFQKM